MTYLATERIAPRLAAVMLLLVAVCGCEREAVAPKAEEKPTRADDPVYKKALEDVQTQRKKLASRRAKVVDQMQKLLARARAALPEGATEEQLRNELQDNPQKYPGWRELALKLRELNTAADKDLDDARRLVAERIRQEQTDPSKRGGAK